MADFPFAADFSIPDPLSGANSMYHVRAQDSASFAVRLQELRALIPAIAAITPGPAVAHAQPVAAPVAAPAPPRTAPLAVPPASCPTHGPAGVKPSQHYRGLYCTKRIDSQTRCNWRHDCSELGCNHVASAVA